MTPDEVHRVLDALAGAGITAGLTGGWGVDALLGRQTRPHEDIDLAVPMPQLDEAIDALVALGYEVAQDQRPTRVELVSGRAWIDLHPVAFDAAGRGVQTGFDGRQFDYPSGSLDASGVIAGRPVRCATPELQLAFHLGYLPRDRDRADMTALAAAFGIELPPPYR